MESYQQLFALIKNSKYVKMCLPENGAATRIEQYCKRRKDRMKPKWQEDSSCVFAYYFVAALAIAAIPQEKNAPKLLRRRSRKKLCKSRQDDTAGKSSRERQAPALYAAVRVRCRSYGVSHILRSVTGRITGHRRSLPQPSSAAWCPPPLHRSRAYLPHVAAY